MLSYKFKIMFNKHFEKNYMLYFIVIVGLTIGISLGAILSKVFDNTQRGTLVSYLDYFFKMITDNNYETGLVMKYSLLNNLNLVFFIWFLGITVIGIPVTLCIVIYRGFILGFTASFLFIEFGFKGFLVSLLGILPQNLFIVSGLIYITVNSLNFSLRILSRKSRKSIKYTFKNEFLKYLLNAIGPCIFIVIGSLIEAYITPLLLRLIF